MIRPLRRFPTARTGWITIVILCAACSLFPSASHSSDYQRAISRLRRLVRTPPVMTRPTPERPSLPYASVIRAAASAHGISPFLLAALVRVESNFDRWAVSPAGARGLAQIMPATARDLGIADLFDPQQNLFGGADYLAQQLEEFGSLRLALAAYNAGPERVRRHAVPRGTWQYVDQVQKTARRFALVDVP